MKQSKDSSQQSKNSSKLERTIILGLVISLLLAIAICVVGFVFSSGFDNFLRFTSCACDCTMLMLPPEVCDDIDVYLSGDYQDYVAGDKAATYFPLPEELGDYESISFYYAHNSYKRKNDVPAPDMFLLDVRYRKEQYEENRYRAFCSYAEGSKEEIQQQYDTKTAVVDNKMNEYLICIEMPLEGDDEYNNYFFLGYDDDDYVIRYIFGYRVDNDDPPIILFMRWCNYELLEYPPAKTDTSKPE